jgi:hypothetical protein
VAVPGVRRHGSPLREGTATNDSRQDAPGEALRAVDYPHPGKERRDGPDRHLSGKFFTGNAQVRRDCEGRTPDALGLLTNHQKPIDKRSIKK